MIISYNIVSYTYSPMLRQRHNYDISVARMLCIDCTTLPQSYRNVVSLVLLFISAIPLFFVL